MAKMVKSAEEVKDIQRRKLAKRVLQVSLVVGIGSGIYGYRLGQKKGFSDGISVGYVNAGQEMMEAWRAHAEELRLARERAV